MPATADSKVHIFGIRHHGPGSARSLGRALEELQPDVILVEGPPDAAAVLPLLIHAEMKPPVALLIYAPDQPQRAVYYPFAIFSPEWQALHYGLSRNLPVRFMDLPQSFQLIKPDVSVDRLEQPEEVTPKIPEATLPEPRQAAPDHPKHDPLGWLAQAAGYSDGERWWEQMVEHRRDGTDLFAAILEAMTTLREATATEEETVEEGGTVGGGSSAGRVRRLDDQLEAQREAYMRQTIRTAQKEGFERIAVVCGAWHTPALVKLPPAKEDAALLKDLPKTKVQATWVPWTYGRLAYTSGYGAGIESPGWYAHLWQSSDRVAVRWLTKVAQLLRAEDLDASPASVIEAVRLAETLAALRDLPLPGLPELNEATLAVLCNGNDTPLKLIHEKLVVSETLGQVPDETPMVPLQQDLLREQKRLRLPTEATKRNYDLDLRKANDLERSLLLHRLNLLGVAWGTREIGRPRGSSQQKGTFHEIWQVQWRPEFAIVLIEQGIWGNRVGEAASAYACHLADLPDSTLPKLTTLLDDLLLADLPEAVNHLMGRIQTEAALASDVGHLMEALPPLALVVRYGNVRQTDTSMVAGVVDGLIARICIGLPGACASLNDEAAAQIYQQVVGVHEAITLLQNDHQWTGQPDHQWTDQPDRPAEEQLAEWQKVLIQLTNQQSLHGLVAGRCCRLLLDSRVFEPEETARRLGLALSTASEPAQAAAWIEGFLKGSGLLLIHDEILWQVLDSWLTTLPGDTFVTLLPLLRRTFSTFAAPERRQLGERAASRPIQSADAASRGAASHSTLPDGNQLTVASNRADFDLARAEAVLPLVAQLLGVVSG